MKALAHLFRTRWIPAATLAMGSFACGCGGGSGSMGVTTPTPPAPPPVTGPPSSSCTTPNIVVTHSAASANAPQIVFLDTSKYPQALCNDGTPAAYVLRPGAGSAATRWVISLQGGDDCYDQTTCAARAVKSPQLISSTPYSNDPSSAFQQSGVQGADPGSNPDFYDATQVQALYCSSDDWSGAKTGAGAFDPNNDATWNFQGHAIVAAVLADLTANHGLSGATEVLFTGESAGGVGVYVNVNAVAKLAPAAARFVSSSDAGFGNIVDNFDPNGAPPNYTDSVSTPAEVAERTVAIPLWNGSGDAACAAKATSITDQVACYSGASLLGSGGAITLPLLVIEAQKDTVQLSADGVPQGDVNSGNFTPAESGYISYFASQMRTNLSSTNAAVSLFSPDEFIHTEDNDSTLFNTPYVFPSGSLTLQQAVSGWYQKPCTAQRNIAN